MNSEIKSQFEDALVSKSLISLVEQMKNEGRTQLQIYHLFESFRALLRETDREADEDDVMDVMDLICGWCGKSARLFSSSLTNEEIEQFQRDKIKL
jgi:predicted RNase H-like nuclease